MNTPALTDVQKNNFSTIQRAFENNDIALLSAIRKSDKKPVALICSVHRDNEGMYCVTPFATMIEGDPFEEFENPVE